MVRLSGRWIGMKYIVESETSTIEGLHKRLERKERKGKDRKGKRKGKEGKKEKKKKKIEKPGNVYIFK